MRTRTAAHAATERIGALASNLAPPILRPLIQRLLSLPPSALLALSGGPIVNDRGDALDPAVQFLVRRLVGGDLRLGHRALHFERMRVDLITPIGDVAPFPDVERSARTLECEDRSVGALIHTPRQRTSTEPLPVCVYFHGGGFVLGSPRSHQGVCSLLAERAGVIVVAVDYALAPECRFPEGLRDAAAATRWVLEHADELGGDPHRVAVAGDSAGGTLATTVARQERERLAFQLLAYPATEFTRSFPSQRLFAHGFLLEESSLEWFLDSYLTDRGGQSTDPLASPYYASDLTGLPPAYIAVAGFDPLRDEGEAYAGKLMEAGVPTELVNERSLVHGFFSMGGLAPAARTAVERAADALARGIRQPASDS